MSEEIEKRHRQVTITKKLEGTWISWLGFPTQFQAIGADTDHKYCFSRAESDSGGGAWNSPEKVER